jgi:hypothetical protein
VSDLRFRWTVEGETHRPNSSPEYEPESASGTIEADGAGEALEMMVRGLGASPNDTIPWDLIDQHRPINIGIWLDDDAPERVR